VSTVELMEAARLSRARAQNCRYLLSLVDQPEAAATLTSYAAELEARASALELQAARMAERQMRRAS
jgi:hypothetical protein